MPYSVRPIVFLLGSKRKRSCFLVVGGGADLSELFIRCRHFVGNSVFLLFMVLISVTCMIKVIPSTGGGDLQTY